MSDRPESKVRVSQLDAHPDQQWVEVVAANGQVISTFPTLYNDPRDIRRAVLLAYDALGRFLDANPVHEVVISEGEPS